MYEKILPLPSDPAAKVRLFWDNRRCIKWRKHYKNKREIKIRESEKEFMKYLDNRSKDRGFNVICMQEFK